MSDPSELKATITSTLDHLPPASLETLAQFASFLESQCRPQAQRRLAHVGGIWRQLPPASEADIAEARAEMWGKVGDRQI